MIWAGRRAALAAFPRDIHTELPIAVDHCSIQGWLRRQLPRLDIFHVSGWGGCTPPEPDSMRSNWTFHSSKESYWIVCWLCGRLVGPGKLLFPILFVCSCLVWRYSSRTLTKTERRALWLITLSYSAGFVWLVFESVCEDIKGKIESCGG